MVTLACWAFASPLGASPDDDFHLTSTWCALGDRPGLCEPTGKPGSRMIPAEIAYSAICYAYHPNQSAGCQAGYDGTAPGQLVTATRGNFDGLYPPVFYAVMGTLASPNIQASAIIMRLLSSLIFVVMATALFLLLPRARRPTLVWAWLISTIPLGIFILASNNPSSWAITSSGSLWIALVGYFETTGRRRVALGAVAVVAALLGAGARSDAAVYSILAVVVAIVLSFERNRRFLLLSILPAAIVAMSAVFYLTSSQGSVAASDTTGSAGAATNPLTLLLSNLLNLPLLWAGVFGSWGLGWLDTPLPGVVSVGALLCFGAVVIIGLRSTDLRKRLALALVAVGLIIFPSYVLLQAGAVVGGDVQPRYILPLIVMLGGVALLAVGDRRFSLSALQRDIIVVLLIVAQAMALHFNMRRYISGLDVADPNLDNHVEWWWGGVPPMVVWAIAVVAFGAMTVILSRKVTTQDEQDPEPVTAR